MKAWHRGVQAMLGALIAVASSSPVAAQPVLSFNGEPTVTFGPIGLTPSLALNSIGIDNNVFNEAVNPKQDFTARLVPGLDTWLRLGRVAGRVRSNVDLVYFKQYANQRAVNTSQDATVAVRLHRMMPYATVQYVNARERPSLEIDARVRRQNLNLGAGVEVTIRPRLTMRLEGHQVDIRYDDEDVYEGTSLSQELNETIVNLRGSVQYTLTPLTSITFMADRQRDRFETSTLRDSNTTRVGAGFDFAPTALIRGRAFVGVRIFDALATSVPDYTGPVAGIDLGYTFRGRTQFAFRADRDLSYSFAPESPYYLQTSIGGSVTRRINPRWDVIASALRQNLDYQPIAGLPQAALPADGLLFFTGTGPTSVYSGGTGFTFGRESRIAFMVDYQERPGGLRERYENLRYYTSVSYAF